MLVCWNLWNRRNKWVWDKEWRSTGTGMVIRNEYGQFLRARNHKLQALYSPREGEAIGLKEALSWVKNFGYRRCVFETDAKELAEALNYVPRSANVVAHELARATYAMSDINEWVDTPPDCICDALIVDSIE
ncbi:hypothetical protein AgCh_001987 [Apium graveolens]